MSDFTVLTAVSLFGALLGRVFLKPNLLSRQTFSFYFIVQHLHEITPEILFTEMQRWCFFCTKATEFWFTICIVSLMLPTQMSPICKNVPGGLCSARVMQRRFSSTGCRMGQQCLFQIFVAREPTRHICRNAGNVSFL